MTTVFAIANQKGGVAKSTSCQNIAASLIRKDYKVLMVDMDMQGNLSYICGADNINKPTIYEVLSGKVGIKDAVQQTKNGPIIPANILLSGADTQFTQAGKDKLLRQALDTIKAAYDYVLVDCPPSLGLLTINALTASDSVIIPMSADVLGIQGLGQLNGTIQAVRKHSNPSLEIEGILFTLHANRTVLAKDFSKAIKGVAKRMGTKIFETTIRTSVLAKEAQANQVDVISYAPASPVAEGYNAVTAEIIKGGAKCG